MSLASTASGALVIAGAALLALAAPSAAQPEPPPSLEAVVAMVESGDLDRAERELRAVLARGESPIASDLLGVVLGKQGRTKEAEGFFLEALALAPDFAPAHRHLARLYLEEDRQPAAARHLRAAARLEPLERDLALRLAAIEHAAGNDAAAREQLASVAERFESVRAMLEMARLDTGRGDHGAALQTLRRAFEIAPNSEAVLRAHSEVSLAAGAPIAAVWTLEPLTRMHPEVTDYPYLLGVARLQVGDASGAADSLERALELDPQRSLTLIAIGLAYNNQKRFEQARAFLVRSLQLEPENPEAIAALAQSEEGLGELELAERHARRALDRAPDHALAHLVLGMVRMKRGEYDSARDALLRAVASNPASVKAHYQLSLAYARLGDRESSQRHLELYREALKRLEEALIELNTRTGTGNSGGMRP